MNCDEIYMETGRCSGKLVIEQTGEDYGYPFLECDHCYRVLTEGLHIHLQNTSKTGKIAVMLHMN